MSHYSRYATESRSDLTFAWVLGAVAIGAAAMFFLDPSQGRRRRALVRDKLASARVQTGKTLDTQVRDLSNRTRGLRHEAARLFMRGKRREGDALH